MNSTSRSGGGVFVSDSPIQGRGLFSARPRSRGETIFQTDEYHIFRRAAFGTVERSKTEHVLEPMVLRWINHSCEPSSRIAFVGNVVRVIALRSIPEGGEITCDYRDTETAIPTPFQCTCGRCCRTAVVDHGEPSHCIK